MKPQRDVPQPWVDRMIPLGFHRNNKASVRRLAEAADVSVGAALRVIHKEDYGQASVVALGEALRDPGFVAEWVGEPVGEPWQPPIQARNMTARQRALVDDIIRELTKGDPDDGWMPEDQKSRQRPSVAVEDGVTIRSSRRQTGPR